MVDQQIGLPLLLSAWRSPPAALYATGMKWNAVFIVLNFAFLAVVMTACGYVLFR
jgi:hypothetical protein